MALNVEENNTDSAANFYSSKDIASSKRKLPLNLPVLYTSRERVWMATRREAIKRYQ
jgi:hypothetical protein